MLRRCWTNVSYEGKLALFFFPIFLLMGLVFNPLPKWTQYPLIWAYLFANPALAYRNRRRRGFRLPRFTLGRFLHVTFAYFCMIWFVWGGQSSPQNAKTGNHEFWLVWFPLLLFLIPVLFGRIIFCEVDFRLCCAGQDPKDLRRGYLLKNNSAPYTEPQWRRRSRYALFTFASLMVLGSLISLGVVWAEWARASLEATSGQPTELSYIIASGRYFSPEAAALVSAAQSVFWSSIIVGFLAAWLCELILGSSREKDKLALIDKLLLQPSELARVGRISTMQSPQSSSVEIL